MPEMGNLIPPRLTLPQRHPLPPAPRMPRRGCFERTIIVMQECFFLALALEGGLIAYWNLSAYPVYRVVALIVIFILWANVASEAARDKAREQAQAWISQAAREWTRERPTEMKKLLSLDTTGYLEAIRPPGKKKKEEEEEDEIRQVGPVHCSVSHHDWDYALLHRSQPAPALDSLVGDRACHHHRLRQHTFDEIYRLHVSRALVHLDRGTRTGTALPFREGLSPAGVGDDPGLE